MTISYDITWDLDPTAATFRGRTSLRFNGKRSHAELAAVQVRRATLNGRDVPWDGSRLALRTPDDSHAAQPSRSAEPLHAADGLHTTEPLSATEPLGGTGPLRTAEPLPATGPSPAAGPLPATGPLSTAEPSHTADGLHTADSSHATGFSHAGAALHGPDDNVLEVDADFAYAEDHGFRRATVDGDTYLYTYHYPNWTQRSFACFEPNLRGAVTMNINAPDASVLTSDTTSPVVPYAITAVVGPWAEVGGNVYAMRTRAAERDHGEAVSQLFARSITYFEHLLGIPYPYGTCAAVFVPDIPSLAFSSAGLVLFDDDAFDALATREPRYATTVVSHEVAHQWSGNLVDAEPWLVEGLATYLSRLATEELVPGSRPWSDLDNAPLPDRPYAAHLSRIVAVEEAIGRTALVQGLTTYFRRHAHTTASWAHLQACWRQ
ncbi:hypothetical protein FHS29_002852 [Saccharothrix tamanrassetensis]|uniref:Peptidase M1 membrane alanine aminopeptidase domain-containing protein n=1 Tax=Saccharothrix tamanrassetensis TaxID=1051531 RepID=A0A841CKY8_9PSEU|nr:M1 family aminopeptidase [Saccharothrix tamanrassetensis]MBB5956266.1 hypothetical protein [Saccharothrix tamanrassetensis]